jgi:adenylate cyclase
VGSTPLIRDLAPSEINAALREFESEANEVIVRHGGRVVKTIGDEVMFVVPDVAAACRASLEIQRFVAGHAVLTSLRGGLAAGDLVRGYGDYYGPEVNIAARLVQQADPDVLLVTDSVRQKAEHDESLVFTPLGLVSLRGFEEEMPVFRLTGG